MKTKKENLSSVNLLPELSNSMALADIFVKSGMFKDIKTQSEAVVKILAGKELGLAPLESMTNIYIVNGKVALQSKVIASLIKKSGKYDYIVNRLDEQECHLTFYKGDKEIGKSIFTFKDAAKAGIVNKDVWKNYPRNMLFARALSNGAKWYCSDVFCGYTPEEIEDGTINEQPTLLEIDTNGNKVEAMQLEGETLEIKDEEIGGENGKA